MIHDLTIEHRKGCFYLVHGDYITLTRVFRALHKWKSWSTEEAAKRLKRAATNMVINGWLMVSLKESDFIERLRKAINRGTK